MVLATIYLIAISHAITLEKNEAHSEAIQMANMIVNNVNARFNRYDLFLNNTHWIYADYIKTLAMQNKYKEAEVLLESCPAAVVNLKQMHVTFVNLYNSR